MKFLSFSSFRRAEMRENARIIVTMVLPDGKRESVAGECLVVRKYWLESTI